VIIDQSTRKVHDGDASPTGLQLAMHFTRWTIGFVVALAIVVLVSGYFMDNFPANTWSNEVAKKIPPEGAIIQWRREGWGSTHYWKWGITGVNDDVLRARQKVLIWGDSYVEAYQVDDAIKLPQQLTSRLADDGFDDIKAIGIGESSACAADWYFGMQLYQERLAPVCVNIIILSQIEDFYPDEADRVAQFVSNPELQFIPAEEKAPSRYSRSMDFYYRWRLQALQKLRDQTIGLGGTPNIWLNLDLRPGPRSRPPKPKSELRILAATREEQERAFDFALSKLREQSVSPLLIVYCPAVPRIIEGRLISEDSLDDIARTFQASCEKYGIHFINMGGEFIAYHERTQRFPRGFPNTRPDRGHFNSEGHALVADAILRELHGWVLP
jgi:lysophospholipase L1-like esterase